MDFAINYILSLASPSTSSFLHSPGYSGSLCGATLKVKVTLLQKLDQWSGALGTNGTECSGRKYEANALSGLLFLKATIHCLSHWKFWAGKGGELISYG